MTKKNIYKLIFESNLFIFLYCFVFKKYSIDILRFIKEKNNVKSKKVAFYFEHPLHYQNLPELIKNLSYKKDTILIVFCGFKKSVCDVKLPDNVSVIYSTSHLFLKWLNADLYISPRSSQKIGFPKGAERLHVFHSLIGIEVYPEDAFDEYDYVFCTGKHHIEELLDQYNKRNKKNKYLIPGGYPKLDNQIQRKKNDLLNKDISGTKTFIYAPTLLNLETKKNSTLIEFGDKIINYVLELNHKLVFRPHPLNRDLEFVIKLKEKYKLHKRFTFDISHDYYNTYSSSDVMITDFSGTAFTYSFSFEKPILFFMTKESLDLVKGSNKIQNSSRNKIGLTASSENEFLENLNEINKNYKIYQKNIVEFRDNIIFNVGKSEAYLAECIDLILENKQSDSWVHIN